MKKTFFLLFTAILFTACNHNTEPTGDENVTEVQNIDVQKMEEEVQRNLSIETEAQSKQKVSICNKIEDPNQKASCKYNIIANQVIANGDVSLCNEIGKDDMIKECKTLADKGN